MTFSILGFCERTKMTGIAVTTSSISVGSRCPWARAGTGAVSTQNITDPSIGDKVLNLIEKGDNAEIALKKVVKTVPYIEYRQVAVIDFNGMTSHFTGKEILGKNSISEGENCIAAGNLLKNPQLTAIMTEYFQTKKDQHLAERLVNALLRGIDFGGEEGPTHSAAVLVAHEQTWPLVDLRVDWSDSCPVKALSNLWKKYEPQLNDYLLRALNPTKAPSYGVPGDE